MIETEDMQNTSDLAYLRGVGCRHLVKRQLVVILPEGWMFLAEVQTFAAAMPRHYYPAHRRRITSAATGGLGLSSLQQTLPICGLDVTGK